MSGALLEATLFATTGARGLFAADPAALEAAGVLSPGARPWRPRQVHGARAVEARRPGEEAFEADAVVSADPSRPALVVTADCVPLLVASADGARVAAIHAGWRGLAAGVLEAGLGALSETGAARPETLRAAVGPAAAGCCYEVGPEVLAALRPPAGLATPTREGRARLDLRGLVRERLLGAGLRPELVELVGPCTICAPSWPSYRREGARAGRLFALVRSKPSSSVT